MVAELDQLVGELEARGSVEAEAKVRFAIGSSAAAARKARYERYHSWYAPLDGDQWPEDRGQRPGKLHLTVNMIQAFVDTEARLLSILPRVTNKPPRQDVQSRKRAEAVEELFARYREMSDWEVWMSDWNRVGGLYGLKVLKPFWNEDDKRPDVIVVEQPQNLLIGYASNDYQKIDWVIYRYSISILEASIQFKDLTIEPGKKGKPPVVTRTGIDHTDPLNQKPFGVDGGLAATMASARVATNSTMRGGVADAYENQHVEVWDYWYRKPDTGLVCNAILVEGCMTGDVKEHPEMPAIPYIITEHEHEPGSPEGRSTVELLIDIQMGINRVLTHFSQLVADNSGTAYQIRGPNADSAPEGIIPMEDEVISVGADNWVEPIQRSVNNFPMSQLLDALWRAAHKVTGLSEILFGELPGSQTAGRAVAIQIEAAANRLDPKRRREYAALGQLHRFWAAMLEKKNPTVTVTVAPDEQTEATADGAPAVTSQEIKIGEAIKGYDRWNIIAPEITPRDATENIQNALALVQGRLSPAEWAMDQVGIENPQQAMALIREERSDVRLNPADVQSYASAWLALAAVKAQLEQAEAMTQQAGQIGAAANAATQSRDQAMTPTKMVDQNQPSGPTLPGGPPPPGAGQPGGGQLQPLTRVTPGGESQAMSQVLGPRVDL